MNRFRFSSDILSPINSDLSLNDTSALSFGSLSGALNFDNEFASPTESVEKDSTIDSVCKRTMKESVAVFDTISNDFIKQTNINAEKEIKFKESSAMLKRSMDDLFHKYAHSSILSPVSNDPDLENFSESESASDVKSDNKVIAQKSKILEKTAFIKSKLHSHISNKKCENKTLSAFKKAKEKEAKQQCKNTYPLREGNCKQHKVQFENETAVKSPEIELQNHKTTKMVSSSVQTDFEKEDNKGKENLKDFYVQKQRKTVMSKIPPSEDGNLSLERYIKTAIGMEIDKIRRFVLDQNIYLQKELLKLQEVTKKQNEETQSLYTTIEELEQENKKLRSKHS